MVSWWIAAFLRCGSHHILRIPIIENLLIHSQSKTPNNSPLNEMDQMFSGKLVFCIS